MSESCVEGALASVLNAVAFKIIERHNARTFSFLYGQRRVTKSLFFAVRRHDLYGFVVQPDGFIVTIK